MRQWITVWGKKQPNRKALKEKLRNEMSTETLKYSNVFLGNWKTTRHIPGHLGK